MPYLVSLRRLGCDSSFLDGDCASKDIERWDGETSEAWRRVRFETELRGH